MAQISELIHLPYYPERGPFNQNVGTVMGLKNGYLLIFGSNEYSSLKGISFILRFKNTELLEEMSAEFEPLE